MDPGSRSVGRLATTIGTVAKTDLENLKDREEVLLQPVLEVPDDKMRVCPVWMKEGLIAKVSARWAKDMRTKVSEREKRKGAGVRT